MLQDRRNNFLEAGDSLQQSCSLSLMLLRQRLVKENLECKRLLSKPGCV
jgi:hypothetical protein